MAIKPKQILDTAFGLGKSAVSAAERRLRGGDRAGDTSTTSGAPATVGATEPGKPGGPKSATAAATTERPPAGTAKAPAAKPKKTAAARTERPSAGTAKAPAAKPKKTAAAARRGATGSGGGDKAATPPRTKRSATPKAAVEEGKAEPEKDKTSTPRKRATGRRGTASQAAASSGDEVAEAASGKDE